MTKRRAEGDFPQIQSRLPSIWKRLESGQPGIFTSVVVPSLSLDPDELRKIPGVPFYEERLLFLLMRLRDPRTRIVYLSSQPIHPEIVDYYLHHLVGVSAVRARRRLTMLCVHDASSRPLTTKILERPRVLDRIRRSLVDPEATYLTCFNSTHLERRLAEALGIPLNGVDPDLLHLGTKRGSRRVFLEAEVDHPAGFEVRRRDELVSALIRLKSDRPDLTTAVVKLDESFAGAGNALFRFPPEWPADPSLQPSAVEVALERLELGAAGHHAAFLATLERNGGIVEEMIRGEDLCSPSVQLRIDPTGEIELVSSHDQVLGGATGQTYLGCRFPAEEAYRPIIQEAALAVGRVLRDRGVISRLGVDFVCHREGDEWRAWAIEINLRMGGTTPPFLALQFLTGGSLDRVSGRFFSTTGREKLYTATDRLESPSYRGLLPEDLVDILDENALGYRAATETGALFHMIGALSEFGKVGLTCIGDSRSQADETFARVREVLDRETGASSIDESSRAPSKMD